MWDAKLHFSGLPERKYNIYYLLFFFFFWKILNSSASWLFSPVFSSDPFTSLPEGNHTPVPPPEQSGLLLRVSLSLSARCRGRVSYSLARPTDSSLFIIATVNFLAAAAS